MRSFSILFVSFLLFILFFCFLLFSRIVDTPVFFVVVAISQLNEIGSGVSCHCVRWTKGISLPNRPRLIWIVRFTILILLWCICFACLSRYSWQVKCLLAEFPLVSIGCCIFFMDFDGRFVTIRSWLEKICASVCRSSPLTDYLLMLNISTFFFFFYVYSCSVRQNHRCHWICYYFDLWYKRCPAVDARDRYCLTPWSDAFAPPIDMICIRIIFLKYNWVFRFRWSPFGYSFPNSFGLSLFLVYFPLQERVSPFIWVSSWISCRIPLFGYHMDLSTCSSVILCTVRCPIQCGCDAIAAGVAGLRWLIRYRRRLSE